jgi:hypothetical protein
MVGIRLGTEALELRPTSLALLFSKSVRSLNSLLNDLQKLRHEKRIMLVEVEGLDCILY